MFGNDAVYPMCSRCGNTKRRTKVFTCNKCGRQACAACHGRGITGLVKCPDCRAGMRPVGKIDRDAWSMRGR